ncbi:MAG: MmgE/PrpD family protein [Proteobacteria bacterium]|nr:MmgE/PrpD family protein [Pseudomonadota bacterium]
MSAPAAAPAVSGLMEALSAYIAEALGRPLPEEVAEKTKHHLLDTLAAIVSGSRLKPGALALRYVETLGGRPEALVAGSKIVTTAVNAALANGISAHADETDDSHKASRAHLGCGVVPAALAMAEREGRAGEALLKAVALGYDIGARTNLALGVSQFYDAGHSTHSFAPLFGAAAAAGALAGLDRRRVRYLLSYTAQQASGVNCWVRDEEHIEKAFDFAGMTAQAGVQAAALVAFGFTGLEDVFLGVRNFLFAYKAEDPGAFVRGLGIRYEILHTNIKKWSVGSPIQAPLDALQALIVEHGLKPGNVAGITAILSDQEAHVVDDRAIPDICLQHLLALMLVDGTVTFAASHDESRVADPTLNAVRKRVRLVATPELPRRQAIVEVETGDGRRLRRRVDVVRGTPDNPMPRAEVEAKALDLIAPVLGADRARRLAEAIWRIEGLKSACELRPLLEA